VLGLIGLVGPSVSAGDGPCKLATKGDSDVAKACKEGGLGKARPLMKKMVKQAKAKMGGELDCKTCHEGVDDDRYDVLKKDGRAQFDKMLAVLKK
jgi:hypothetical protein